VFFTFCRIPTVTIFYYIFISENRKKEEFKKATTNQTIKEEKIKTGYTGKRIIRKK